MAEISQTTFSNAISRMNNLWISINISLKFVPKGPINNIPGLVQIMNLAPTKRQSITWTNDGQFTDPYMCHSALMCLRL